MTDADQSTPPRNPDRRPELEDRLRETNALSRADRLAKGGHVPSSPPPQPPAT
ncbi:hypothetical protein [Streptomyces sp. RFCAC02]|uniref:hypothetical protein n=1 Tax=Streptomyces sp. RFCAC02 TaxID=2499143 RepID=UPI00143DE3FD|nr:hypothetical protein [Streptomyces sp. RFCAC02]